MKILEKKQNKTEVQNQIMQKYLSLSTNYVVCIDITTLGVYGELFLAVDVAARNIVGHCFNSKHITTSQVCETIVLFHRKRSFLPRINIMHSDRESIFSNEEYFSCLKQLNIKQSRGSPKRHQNQVVERLNRTIKDILRNRIDPDWVKTKWDPFKRLIFSPERMSLLVHQGIEFYNQRPHRFLHSLSPNQMEEALFLQHGGQHPENVGKLIVANDNSIAATAMRQYKEEVSLKYQGSWANFFVEWRAKQENFQVKLVEEIRDNKQRNEQQSREMAEKYENLYTQNLELQRKVEEVHQESLVNKQEREDRQLRKLKKKDAQKLRFCDPFTKRQKPY